MTPVPAGSVDALLAILADAVLAEILAETEVAADADGQTQEAQDGPEDGQR